MKNHKLFKLKSSAIFAMLFSFSILGSTRTACAEEKIDVEGLKKKYWEGGSNETLKVIQNRTYTKAGKLNLGVLYGALTNDPFLNTSGYGFKVGFDFTEFFGINLSYQSMSNTHNSAYDALVSVQGFGSNSNPISTVMSGELVWSVLYGKVSVVGLSIVHFDAYLTAGMGTVAGTIQATGYSKNWSALAPSIGIGQQAFIGKRVSLSAAYHVFRYTANTIEQNRPGSIGNVLGSSVTYAGSTTVGINFFLF